MEPLEKKENESHGDHGEAKLMKRWRVWDWMQERKVEYRQHFREGRRGQFQTFLMTVMTL